MSEEQIQQIYAGNTLPRSGGLGLRNVMDRIRMCSRGMGDLTIESKVSHYTKIMIKQPRENCAGPENDLSAIAMPDV